MRGFSGRLRFLAAFGWCRNDIGESPPVGISIFVPMTEVIRRFALLTASAR